MVISDNQRDAPVLNARCASLATSARTGGALAWLFQSLPLLLKVNDAVVVGEHTKAARSVAVALRYAWIVAVGALTVRKRSAAVCANGVVGVRYAHDALSVDHRLHVIRTATAAFNVRVRSLADWFSESSQTRYVGLSWQRDARSRGRGKQRNGSDYQKSAACYVLSRIARCSKDLRPNGWLFVWRVLNASVQSANVFIFPFMAAGSSAHCDAHARTGSVFVKSPDALVSTARSGSIRLPSSGEIVGAANCAVGLLQRDFSERIMIKLQRWITSFLYAIHQVLDTCGLTSSALIEAVTLRSIPTSSVSYALSDNLSLIHI